MPGDCPVFDVDSHFMEPPDFWAEHLEPAFARARPRGLRRPRRVGRRRRPPLPHRALARLAGGLHDAQRRCGRREYARYDERGWDPEAYVMAMDDQGIDQMVLYPSRGLMQVAAWGLDPKLAAAIVRAYNDWAAKFVAHVPDRLLAVGQLDAARRRRRDRRGAPRRRAARLPRRSSCSPSRRCPGVTLERDVLRPAVGDARGARRRARAPQRRRHRPRPDRRRPLRRLGAPPHRRRVPARVAAHAVLVPRRRHLRPPPRAARRRARVRRGLAAVLAVVARRAVRALRGPRLRRAVGAAERAVPPPVLRLGRDGGAAPARTSSTRSASTASSPRPTSRTPRASFPDGVRDFAARADLTDAEKRAILWDNPHRLYGVSLSVASS